MSQSIFDIQADFCKAMGHPVRLQILNILRDGPLNVGHLAERIGLSQPTVSRQLHIMRTAGIVEFERHGTELVYKLANMQIGEMCDIVHEVVSEQFHKHSKIL